MREGGETIPQTDFYWDGQVNGKMPDAGLNGRNRDASRLEQRQLADEPPGLTAIDAVRNQKCSARLCWRVSSRQDARALWQYAITPEQDW